MSQKKEIYKEIDRCFFDYIAYLNSLVEEMDNPMRSDNGKKSSSSQRNTRAILARFRESLRRGSPYEILKYIQRYIDDLPAEISSKKFRKIEDSYILMAGLVGLYPTSSRYLEDKYSNLGKSFMDYEKELNDNRAGPSDNTRISSTERRFMALLKAKEENLPQHLQQSVRLLGSKKISVNWLQLLKDINEWKSEKIDVRRNWARAFWTTKKPQTTDDIKEKREEEQ